MTNLLDDTAQVITEAHGGCWHEGIPFKITDGRAWYYCTKHKRTESIEFTTNLNDLEVFRQCKKCGERNASNLDPSTPSGFLQWINEAMEKETWINFLDFLVDVRDQALWGDTCGYCISVDFLSPSGIIELANLYSTYLKERE